MAVTVTLPDGKALELQDGATGADAAAAIGPGLARAALAVEVSDPKAGEGSSTGRIGRQNPIVAARPLARAARRGADRDRDGQERGSGTGS
jgi:hypothetical protein